MKSIIQKRIIPARTQSQDEKFSNQASVTWIRFRIVPFSFCRVFKSIKATFHLTIPTREQRETGKIQRNNYHHGSCGPSLTGKTISVFLIFTQGTHRNVKNR